MVNGVKTRKRYLNYCVIYFCIWISKFLWLVEDRGNKSFRGHQRWSFLYPQLDQTSPCKNRCCCYPLFQNCVGISTFLQYVFHFVVAKVFPQEFDHQIVFSRVAHVLENVWVKENFWVQSFTILMFWLNQVFG